MYIYIVFDPYIQCMACSNYIIEFSALQIYSLGRNLYIHNIDLFTTRLYYTRRDFHINIKHTIKM